MSLPLSYKDAAFILKQISAKKGSVNSLISQIPHETNINLVYLLVSKTLKNLKIINSIIESNNLLSQINFDSFLAQILIADLLFGKGLNHIRHVSFAKQILSYEKQLRESLNNAKSEPKVNRKGKSTINNEQIVVRYVRVNLIKTTLRKVIKKLLKKRFQQIEYNHEEITFDQYKDLVKRLTEGQFLIDIHFKDDLIALSMTSTKMLQSLRLYREGKIIFQDKASLMAVECLDLRKGMKILDVCCAPGMKTAAIASRLNNDATIVSVDMDESRLYEMQNILDKTGVTCSKITQMDFTKLTPNEIGPIDAILLDPSCSGSGMNKRAEYHNDIHADKGRLLKLASFQTKMLCHAMSFHVKRIVYSTCSLSVLENEQVIKSAFKESPNSVYYNIVKAMPLWEIRGLGDYQFKSKCIRSDAKSLTNGTFVCVLVRD